MLSRLFGHVDGARMRLTVAAGGMAIVLIAVLSIGFSYLALSNYRHNVSSRDESRAILIAAKDTEAGLSTLHAAAFQYLETGEQESLNNYFESSASATARLAHLIELNTDTEHTMMIESTVPGVISTFDDAVAAAARGEPPDTVMQRVGSDATRDQLARADAALEHISGSENQRVVTLTAATNRRAMGVALGLTMLVLINLGLLAVLALYLRARNNEAILRRANESKDSFVGFVSHELRNPIASIVSGAALLQRRMQTLKDSEREEVLQTITEEAERLERRVSNMLMVARQDVGEAETEPLLLQRLIPQIAAAHQHRFPSRTIETRIADGLDAIEGNSSFIEEVVLNLLGNAEKYGDQTTPIGIEVQNSGETVRVTVSNRGPEIDPRSTRAIFEPFVRGTKPNGKPGAGLGLAVCQKLVELQHGRIWAEPRRGGALFAFALPKARLDLEYIKAPGACCG